MRFSKLFASALFISVFSVILAFSTVQSAFAQGDLLTIPIAKPIRGMNTPALSPDGKTICFSYQGDLWTVPSTGGTASRLTVHEAHDVNPHYSPNGKWITFASNREGKYDIYVIPAVGGSARQLTFNTINEYPQDWSPDGSKVLFYSMRGVDTWNLYAIDVKTGVVKTVTGDDNQVRYASYSPDGTTVAYNRCGAIGTWWRPRYHGSANMDIFTKNLTTGKISRVTDYDGTDLWPMYAPDGKSIYYSSDKLTPGTPNILKSPATGGKPSLVTNQKTDAVRWPSMAHDGSLITYLHDGNLYTVKPSGGPSTIVNIIAISDDKINNFTRLNLTNSATEVEISPDGKTLALVIRGELWTIPTTGGNAKRLTKNPAHDYDIAWSKDGKSLLFVSDRNGNFNIFTIDVATKEEKQLSNGPSDDINPHLSPDGKLVAFLRSGTQGGIYVTSIDGTGLARKIVESNGNNLEFGIGINSYSWSPDGKYIAFSRRDSITSADVWVATVADGKSINVTYTPGDNIRPEWTSDGKFLVFISDRDRIPNIFSLLLVPAKSEPEPAATSTPDEKKPLEVKIDFTDIENRSKAITTTGVGGFELSPDGKSVIYPSAAGGAPEYFSVPVGGGPAQRMTLGGDGTGLPRFGTDPNLFYALGTGGTVRVVRRTGPIWQAQPIVFSAVMEFDRKLELRQAFNEFWRRLNTGFYDPNMHGVDWRATRSKYANYLEGIGTKEEFAFYFLSPLVGELNASHTEISPAGGVPTQVTAELGLSYDENYAGPGLKVTGYMPKGPNDDLGPKVKPGEFILQIDGEDVTWNESMYKLLFDKAGKSVELLVNSRATKDGARIVKVKPITMVEWRNLEYDRKVKVARDEVDKLSNGRFAYLHIKGMDQPSLRQLERELWGKARDKDALVLDIRNNGGGNTHDTILAQISRPIYGYEQPRDAAKITQPVRVWNKPIILLMNQNSASDAEIFPNGFRALKLGKIVGNPTPGYVIGTFNQTLQDGTGYRIPMFGWFKLDGKDMENNGVKPDILVELTDEDMANHNDRQLQVAVQALLKEVPRK
ncbi:MAG: S41 family peptidase [Chthonomonadales bacterium]